MTASDVAEDARLDDYAEVDELFEAVAQATDDDERRWWRDQIITRCLSLADHIAYRFAGRGEPCDDLVQVARLGLVYAVDRYNPAKGRFLSFAVPTILGEVRRHFRDHTWTMRVPRRVQETRRKVRTEIDNLSQRLGRSPSPSELAAELDVSCEDIRYALAASNAYQPMSLDAAIPGSDDAYHTLGARQAAEDTRYAIIEDLLALSTVVCELSDREKTILQMRFGDCLTQTQIAQRLGISQVHVSRLLSTTLDRLRGSDADLSRVRRMSPSGIR